MFREKIEEYRGLIEEALEESLYNVDIVDPLRTSVAYVLFPGGKRLRPLLSMFFHDECGGTAKDFAPVAVSLELIHSSSLVHDDLPAVDNDDMRRGKASCHKAYGEGSAIFAGDLLISLGALSISRSSFAADLKLRMLDALMETFSQICNGQQYDILPEEKRPSLFEIDRRKTGDLFGTTLSIAAIGAAMDEDFVVASRRAGQQLGLCFQMLDDYIDVFGTDAERGRAGSSDAKKAKQTFFSGMSLERGKEEWAKAKKRLDEDLYYLEIKGPAFPLTRAFISQLLSRVEIK